MNKSFIYMIPIIIVIIIVGLLFLLINCDCKESFTTNEWKNMDFNQKIKHYCKLHKKYNFFKYADKYNVKNIVKSKGYKSPQEVNIFTEENFVCKPNNTAGKLLIVKDGIVTTSLGIPDNCDIRKGDTVQKVRNNYPKLTKEWSNQNHPNDLELWYNDIPFKMVCEELLPNNDDYKFHVFNGKVKLVQIHYGRGTSNHRALHTDKDYNLLDVSVVRENVTRDKPIMPKHWYDMVTMAEDLGGEFPYVRIDIYHTEDGPLLGEYTFSPNAGNTIIKPENYKKQFSNYWESPPTN